MAEEWFAVVNAASGELVSVGTVVSDRLDKELETVRLPRKPDWSRDAWSPALLALVPRPPDPLPKDRVDDILNNVDVKTLGVLDQEKVRAALIAALPPDARFY